jgi:hypothetical protein
MKKQEMGRGGQMKLAIAAAVTLCVACADLAVAQVQPPQDRINTALARARQVGIPVSLLESKIAEGKAKGVSLDRIAAAIERREANLERASQVMKGQQGTADADLGVAADALETGVSDAVLKAVSESAPRDRRAVAIAALTQLVQMGHGSEVALAKVRDALKRGPEALLNLPGQEGRGRGRGSESMPMPEDDDGRGKSSPKGPPSSVPAPGQSTEPTKPKKPETPPGQTTDPGRGRGK